MFIPISLVFFNVLASSVVLLSTNFIIVDGKQLQIQPQKDTWMSHYDKKRNYFIQVCICIIICY